jgi:TolA-binding protein
MISFRYPRRSWIVFLPFVLFFAAGSIPPAGAQSETPAAESELDREFRFMSGLIEINMGDYAEKALERLLVRHPDQKERAKIVQAEIAVSRRKFDEAEQLARSLPAGSPRALAITLAIANGYYRIGETDKAKNLYQEFFGQFAQKPTDPDLLKFYQESAYRYALMLKNAGDLEGAIKAYDRVFQAMEDREIRRRLQAEQAQLAVDVAMKADDAKKREEYLSKAWKISEELQWGGIDMWFGESLVIAARAEKGRGSKAKAEQTLRDNLDLLQGIDQALKDHGLPLSESPMAGARFLLGEINEELGLAVVKDPAKKDEAIGLLAKAINQYYTVFKDYGDSEWGTQAGLKVIEIKGQLEALGKQVKLPEIKVQAGPEQFKFGDNLYREKKYAEAITEYLRVVNRFPESPHSIRALSNVLQAHAQLGDRLMAQVLSAYLGERFAGNETAATALLVLGKHYFDAQDEEMYTLAYETFLKYFPKNVRAPSILYTMAGIRKRAGDEAGRMAYLERIIENYPGDKSYLQTLQQLAWDNFGAQNWAEAAKYFPKFIAEAQFGPDKAKAQFALATTLVRLGQHAQALREYNQLVKWLEEPASRKAFDITRAAVQENDELLEKAKYQLAYTLSILRTPAEQQAAVQGNAIRAFDQFLAAYPASEMAPRAMSGKGRMQLGLGQFDQATATFEDLAKKYPQSEEGKNALYSLIKAAMEVNKVEVAKDAFANLLINKQAYSPAEFARIGKLMLDVKSYPEAAQAYQQVVDSQTEDRALMERALFGLGQASFEMKDFTNAAKYFALLNERYPQSRLTHAAKFQLASAYRQTGRLDEAITALVEVARFGDDPGLRTKTSYEVAHIELQRDNKKAAYASYQRVLLLEDPKNTAVRPLWEKCLLESLPLGMELGLYDDVAESCDLYLNNFPQSTRIEEVRRLRAEARLKKSQEAP